MKCILMSCMNIDNDMVKAEVGKIINPNMKVVCIPFASDLQWLLNGDKNEYFKRHYTPFAEYGIKKYNFYIANIRDDYKYLKKKIRKADIVYFSGGYMENLMYHLKNKYLVRYLKNLRDEKIFIGESAGALVLQDMYIELPHIEDHYKVYKKECGVGIVNNLEVMVHYNPNDERHRYNLDAVKSMTKKEVVALTDSAMIIADDNKTIILGETYK